MLVRSDLNVPLVNGRVSDAFRIDASLETINEVRSLAKRTIVASHLGRPDGVDPSLSMAPVAKALGERGGFETVLAPGVFGPEVVSMISDTRLDSVIVLENTRFEPGETTNDPQMAEGLAALADVFVSDAFGTAHRAHASNVGVATRLPSVAGRLLASEISAFTRLLADVDRPYVVVMGGAKISDKLAAIEHLLPKVDLMLVGGGMCFTLLRAAGFHVGESLVEESMIKTVGRLLDSELGDKIVLPTDIVVADSFAPDAPFVVAPIHAMPGGGIGLDIGPETISRFAGAVVEAEAVFWNGPMGVFEWESFRAGTEGVAEAVASADGYTVVGGGDSVAAIRLLGLQNDVTHVSSGGGASLAMLEGAELPGISVLERKTEDA
ncbi:MAG: phosphoglycerate kinase [Acidimicrobiia bacterium]|nr:MAG: phosphoglycerate kinase [Acidimicrobiia bacterium]